ncbi:MAG: hypothetical protein XU15_C0011G0039 [candidate division NC10 bacterium CSP1-5]|nr:MAG: hypothetical protein XU15_C0011G0039 [candidate division NC10 bacterium CSP1-5]
MPQIDVPTGTREISCPQCAAAIVISRRKYDNPIYCEACGCSLQIRDEDTGDWLNLWWAPLESELARFMGKTFGVIRFPSEAMSLRWGRFERRHEAERIKAAAHVALERMSAHPMRDLCFSTVIAMIEKRDSVSPRNVDDAQDTEVVVGINPLRSRRS